MKCIAIFGPTASGKTAVSVPVAMALGGEIISCDSMQIYRGMDIGTAKPPPEALAAVRHSLVGFLSPRESYSAADYRRDAVNAALEAGRRGAVPVFVGGTGLYLDAVRYERHDGAPAPDPTLRAGLRREAEELGAEALYARLAKADPDAAAGIHPNNLPRVIRALEIYMLSGRKKSEFDAESRGRLSPQFDMLVFTLNFHDRAALYARIDRRVSEMLEAGLVREAEELYRAGLIGPGTAGAAIGYKELLPYLRGEETLREAEERIARSTRRYAKRQLTWSSSIEGGREIFVDRPEGGTREVSDIAEEILGVCRENGFAVRGETK